MTSCLARLRLVLASCFLVSAALAQPPGTPGPLPQNPAAPPPAASATSQQPSVPPAGDPNEPVTLKFPDAEIDTVINILENLTGRSVIRPQVLNVATYNLRTPQPLPKWKAIIQIETALAMNNIGIVPLGDDWIKMVNLANVRTEAPELIVGSALDLPASGRAASKLFQLDFMRVAEFVPMIQQGILNPFYQAGVIQFPNANAFLVTDSVSNLQRIEVLLQQVDKPATGGMRPWFYTLRNGAKASDVVNKMRTILGPMQNQLGTQTSYNADDRTNQIVVMADPRQWPFFQDLIEKLDQKSDPNTRTEVLYLKHAKAEDVVKVLNPLITGQTSALQRANPSSIRPGQGPTPPPPGLNPPQPPQAQPQQPAIASAANNPNLNGAASANEFSALMTVVNDERSNAVVVFGTADDIRLVRDLVDKLDIVLAQVRVEVVIAEITLDDNDSSGISALGLQVEGDKLVGFSAILEGASDRGATISDGIITRPGTSGRFDLAATISVAASLRKRNNSIVTVPAIITSHGKPGKFFNGETRPVVTGSVVSGTVGGTTSTTTQQEIGTTLTVTPFIGVDGSVQLELTQDVQDVTGEVLIDGNTQYIIGKRQTESYVTTKSGEIIVLGGFRKNSSISERGRLGPIPILGDLFGPRSKSKGRQELIFFLRPTVLTNTPAIDNAEELKRIEQWSTRDAIKKELDRSYVPLPAPSPSADSLLDKILPR
jgi:general secretion pathway protein D